MKGILVVTAWLFGFIAIAQKKENGINTKEVLRIESVLAADDMKGRQTGSAEIDRAAQFIANEFAAAGIDKYNGSYLQEFVMVRPRFVSVKAEMDDVEIDAKDVIVITTTADLKINEKAGYIVDYLTAEDAKDAAQWNRKARGFTTAKQNTVVFVDTSMRKNFARLSNLRRQLFKSPYSTIFILGNYRPKEFTIKAEHVLEESTLKNVVGVIPGKSRKNEYVIFSAHYDHIGIGKPVEGDSIYNGANDDAAGTTAVIMLAHYFKKLGDNERTVLFVAFTAEESGGYGSQYFSRQLDPKDVVAMFNIEMIGTESKWGRNSAFITGFDVTDMSTIMQANLKGTAFTFHPDPYPDQQLFYRSDNATLARLGVPAHTISTAKMENEPHYHKPSDEIKTLDLANMAEIIKAIALSSKTIISGKDTPTRVKTGTLR